MAENFRLKDAFGLAVPLRIGADITAVYPAFDDDAFQRDVEDGYEELELMQRAHKIARAMHAHLPAPGEALLILLASLPPLPETDLWHGMDGFLLMPHVIFVRDHGLDYFSQSMTLQYEITKRFTAEFSIRAFIEHDYARTMARLHDWATDPDDNVRRLVSEGTRPRLPWASRLRVFQEDPEPVIELLEKLVDDPSDYVRRSVANNLNDISKDHPDIAIAVSGRWLAESDSPERRWVVRHGLRTLIKRGDSAALAAIGYGSDQVTVAEATIEPARPHIGESVVISLTLRNDTSNVVHALIDLVVGFIKADGSTNAKTFKGSEISLDPGDETEIRKRISLKQHTTRTHYTGTHQVTALINGARVPVGEFEVMNSD